MILFNDIHKNRFTEKTNNDRELLYNDLADLLNYIEEQHPGSAQQIRKRANVIFTRANNIRFGLTVLSLIFNPRTYFTPQEEYSFRNYEDFIKPRRLAILEYLHKHGRPIETYEFTPKERLLLGLDNSKVITLHPKNT